MSVSSIFSTGSDWLAQANASIVSSQQQSAGIMGALQSSGNGSSLSATMAASRAISNNLATIAQSSVSNANTLLAQVISQRQQKEYSDRIAKLQNELAQQSQMVQPTNKLDSFIYFDDGTTIDTANNIMTKPDGSQIDTTTGAEYIDPASLVQMANGAYLNTKTNILTMADGTKIDTVTGLSVTTTA